jgi:FKBP-type peptidyl-prolyl cis-trans isomerase
LQQVIKGWTEGILFQRRRKRCLLIPSSLGYGKSTRGPIPGGSVLLFDIKLIKVN